MTDEQAQEFVDLVKDFALVPRQREALLRNIFRTAFLQGKLEQSEKNLEELREVVGEYSKKSV